MVYLKFLSAACAIGAVLLVAARAADEITDLRKALKRLSFAAQTTGGTAGPDDELMAAIGQAEAILPPVEPLGGE